MSNTYKLGSPLEIGRLSADPSPAVNGVSYYNTTSNKFRQCVNGAFQDVVDAAVLATLEASLDSRFDAVEADVIDIDSRLTAVEADAGDYVQTADVGAPNGVAPLDGTSKIPAIYLPGYVDDVLEYANLAAFPVTGESGKLYLAIDTEKSYRWSGSVYVEVSPSDVNSVNGQTGIVVLDTDDVAEGATNQYHTQARARAAAVADSINDGVTDVAPSQNAVFDALALKANDNAVTKKDGSVPFTGAQSMGGFKLTNLATPTVGGDAANKDYVDSAVTAGSGISDVEDDTTPTLGGDLDMNGKALMGPMHRSAVASPTNFIEEEYIHSTALTASQTNTVLSALSFAHASIRGIEVSYSIIEATTNRVKIGTLRVVSNGTDVSYVDVGAETADVGTTFDAVISGGNVNVRYTTTANAKTLRADIKRFKV